MNRLVLLCLLLLACSPAAAQPLERFTRTAPAQPAPPDREFAERKTIRHDCPSTETFGGVLITDLSLDREFVKEYLRSNKLSSVLPRPTFSRLAGGWDMRWRPTSTTSSYYLVEMRQTHPLPTRQEYVFRIRVAKDGRYLLYKSDKEVTPQDKLIITRIVKTLEAFYGDTDNLRELHETWDKKLGRPLTTADLYMAMATVRRMPVEGMHYDEMVRVFGKPTWERARGFGRIVHYQIDAQQAWEVQVGERRLITGEVKIVPIDPTKMQSR